MGAKPLSVANIVRLLQELKVSPQAVAEAVRKQGVNFEVTDAVRKQLRDAGADDGLLLAIERESMAYARKVLEDERRKIEEDKKRAADEAKRQQSAEDAQRKAEEAAKRKEDVRQQAEERKQREAAPVAERKEKEDAERRRRADEQRQTGEMVSVGSFKIDKTEVTVAAYRRCVDAGGCTAPNTGGACNWNVSGRGNHPINCVDWYQAQAYCAWAGKRLPTEEEWKRAAYGTDRREYPWGNEWDATRANLAGSKDGYETTVPVGSFPAGASPYGALDMAGNVWEWTASEGGRGDYVILGGAWFLLPQDARASGRRWPVPGKRSEDLGMRCAQ